MQLTSIEASSTGHPRWSPDGTRIAFESYVRGVGQIFVISAAGGAPRRLIDTTHEVRSQVGRTMAAIFTTLPANRTPGDLADSERRWRITNRPIQITKQGAWNQALESADGFRCDV
jgi:hypothetical protein